ncbi:glycine betaine ABC transporter substrate-binding protein [Massilia sp. YIM B02763]|uniref:glycine betaine ABC transporter substrate-binding protein n=1 Tax=Massilia sp. YIM B02763 TaxID=3050130 RepID=UPI0025B64425|nr:glycine betaine ABC transporter substrate-binding protein [Massilia sp. YIM B02763]MDN4055268.1 glycine betaine ABC transporter substrate-binding protein [Massilia sp. YIM B02763]
MPRIFLLLLACAHLLLPALAHAEEPLRVGSKRFTESYILGEILTQAAAKAGPAEHKQGLGNTAIVLSALRSGAIDVYPEYLGTIGLEILKDPQAGTLEQMRAGLRALGLGVAVPLGFSNGYALATRGDAGIERLSQLAARPDWKIGLSHEFLGRGDGWPGLARRYGLPQQPRGLDHGIAYEALLRHQVDAIDIYSTDAKIHQYGLRVLADDKDYFPRYDAVLLYRLDLPQRLPKAWQALTALEGTIAADDMIAMNAEAELDKKHFAAIARAWLSCRVDGSAVHASGARVHCATNAATAMPTLPGRVDGTAVHPAVDGLWTKTFGNGFGPLARQHLLLVALAVLLGCAAGIPLGIVAALVPRLRQAVLALAGVLQTVPSLALLAMLIPLLGRIGTVPALVALCAYALLPIVRNTCTGLLQVPKGLRTAALALGMTRAQALRHVELPLAAPVILAGIKTAAVMSVGTATIAAFIGAGGFGERITTGLALNDNDMMLAGAIPAALLALLTQAGFEAVERLLARRRGA